MKTEVKRRSVYKPLLLTTTIRNPERLKWMLAILKGYNGKLLTNELAEEICGEIIKAGLYTPTKLTPEIKAKVLRKEPLDNKDIGQLLKDNPQNHKEAGFSKGWASRFDTFFKMAKEFGFVFYKIDEYIKFSEVGLSLVDSQRAEFEQQAFLNALVKYQSNNPFRRVSNENVPLILLLQVIRSLNNDPELKPYGISKLEIPLVIYWKDSNYRELHERIKKLRKDFGFNPSPEIIAEICQNEIMSGNDIKRNVNSITKDYPDDFIRKMRLTGLISIRGGGKFIDINRKEGSRVDYILSKYDKYPKFTTEESYFDYISQIDKRLVGLSEVITSRDEKADSLLKWMLVYNWSAIQRELRVLSGRGNSSDNILKYMAHPVRLEFLIALAIKTRRPSVSVIPNYPIDDEGLPTSTAGGQGNKGDIECFEDEKGTLVEVTMSQGRTQTMMEIWPIARHLSEFKKKSENSKCIFIAPSIYSDSVNQIEWVKEKETISIVPRTIDEFVDDLSGQKSL